MRHLRPQDRASTGKGYTKGDEAPDGDLSEETLISVGEELEKINAYQHQYGKAPVEEPPGTGSEGDHGNSTGKSPLEERGENHPNDAQGQAKGGVDSPHNDNNDSGTGGNSDNGQGKKP
jgi:hypothetical protein